MIFYIHFINLFVNNYKENNLAHEPHINCAAGQIAYDNV